MNLAHSERANTRCIEAALSCQSDAGRVGDDRTSLS